MKKLYKVCTTHYAPKDSSRAIMEYVVAEKDRDVFEYLSHGYAYWEDILEYVEDDDKECAESEYWGILDNKGDYREVYDLYYGATQYDWEEVNLVDDSVIELMIENGLAEEIQIYQE